MKTDKYKNSKGEQIDFELKVFTRPNLRGSMSEMLMYRGKPILQTMFDKNIVDSTVTEIDMEELIRNAVNVVCIT